MHLSTSLFLLLASYEVSILAEHIAELENGPADALSRGTCNYQFFLGTISQARTFGGTRGAQASASQPARLDITELDKLAEKFYRKSLAESSQSTLHSYHSGQSHFLAFCHHVNIRALPASETELCQFMSFLAGEKLRHRVDQAALCGSCETGLRHICQLSTSFI